MVILRDSDWFKELATRRLEDAVELAFDKDVPSPGMSDLQRRAEGWPACDKESRRDSLTAVGSSRVLWEEYQHYPGGDGRIV